MNDEPTPPQPEPNTTPTTPKETSPPQQPLQTSPPPPVPPSPENTPHPFTHRHTTPMTSQAPMTPQAPTPSTSNIDPDYSPMEEHGFSHILNNLLKKPLSVIYEITHETGKPQQKILTSLLLISLVSLAIFGVVLGMFSSGSQLWTAPVKVVGGVFFSGLICLPSLYIFGALGGMDSKVQHIVGLMLTFLAITSLLLVGFAPVVWLFSTSSNSLVFFGFLSLSIWGLCLVFGLRIVTRASKSLGGGKGSHLHIWAVIFMLVTLQMTTTLRPFIGKSDSSGKPAPFLNLEEKRFFIHYWFEMMAEDSE